jgi:hypothetical protein
VTINGKAAKFADLKPKMAFFYQRSLLKPSELFNDRPDIGNNYLILSIEALGRQVHGEIKAVHFDRHVISVHIPEAQMTADNVAVAKDAKIRIDGQARPLSDVKAGMRVILQMSAETERSFVIGITTVGPANNPGQN